MARIDLFGLGQLAKSPFVTAKRMVNMYAEQRPAGEKAMLVAYGTPGLDLFVDFGASPVRGGLEFQGSNLCYVVHRNVLWEINNAGVTTSRGVLASSSGRVSMAQNGVQVMIVDGSAGYIYNTSTTAFAQISDPQFPSDPQTVTLLGRCFVVSVLDSSRFFWSDIDDGLTWNALDFANAESSSDPIIAVLATNGQLALLGTQSTEWWGLSGTPDQAFIALPGAASEWGLAARWSLAMWDNTYACLVRNRMGQVMVAAWNGYLPRKISTVDMDYIINSYSTVDDASGYSYMLGGHPMYVLNFPTSGASWLYDGSTNQWSQLKSYGLTRHYGEFSFPFFGRMVVADYSVGRLYHLSTTNCTDNGVSIEREIVSETVEAPGQEFITVDCLRLDMEVGVGLAVGQGSDPQIGLQVSRDNGKTWGAQMWKSFGRAGMYDTRVEWRRLGTARGFVFKLSATDPVPFNVVSACINPEN